MKRRGSVRGRAEQVQGRGQDQRGMSHNRWQQRIEIREGAGCIVIGAGACEGHAGHIWDGGSALRRGGVRQNMLGCIEGGRGTCVRLWLGLGHMKGAQDVSWMAVAH